MSRTSIAALSLTLLGIAGLVGDAVAVRMAAKQTAGPGRAIKIVTLRTP